MKPEEIGRRFGIGVRVAGRIARQRMEENPSGPAAAAATGIPSASDAPSASRRGRAQAQGRAAGQVTRAAGRGVAGFLKPFRRVGGILWLEVTGFFFGLFAAGFAVSLWRTRMDYAHGPHHQQFLIAAGLTAVFAYLSVSAFWRARRR